MSYQKFSSNQQTASMNNDGAKTDPKHEDKPGTHNPEKKQDDKKPASK